MRGEYVDHTPVEVIEQESGEDEDDSEIDEGKVKKDLMKHVEDPSDFYVSPPSNTPVKSINQFDSRKREDSNESVYMLQDIIDLQTKIHSYIKNFNKKRSSDMGEV